MEPAINTAQRSGTCIARPATVVASTADIIAIVSSASWTTTGTTAGAVSAKVEGRIDIGRYRFRRGFVQRLVPEGPRPLRYLPEEGSFQFGPKSAPRDRGNDGPAATSALPSRRWNLREIVSIDRLRQDNRFRRRIRPGQSRLIRILEAQGRQTERNAVRTFESWLVSRKRGKGGDVREPGKRLP